MFCFTDISPYPTYIFIVSVIRIDIKAFIIFICSFSVYIVIKYITVTAPINTNWFWFGYRLSYLSKQIVMNWKRDPNFSFDQTTGICITCIVVNCWLFVVSIFSKAFPKSPMCNCCPYVYCHNISPPIFICFNLLFQYYLSCYLHFEKYNTSFWHFPSVEHPNIVNIYNIS